MSVVGLNWRDMDFTPKIDYCLLFYYLNAHAVLICSLVPPLLLLAFLCIR